MKNRQKPSFPFDLIVLWARPYHGKPQPCMFCKQDVSHIMHHAVDLPPMQAGIAMLNMDELWRKAIQKQMSGDYSFAYYQPACLECTQHFASIALGKKRPIQQLLSWSELAKKQRGFESSLVICATVQSLNDEGDTWTILAPNTSIEDVVKHVREQREHKA